MIQEWQLFLTNLRDLCEHKLDSPTRDNYGQLRGLVNDVIDELQSDDAMEAVRNAVKTADRNPDNKKVNAFLERELKFFNSLIAESRNYDTKITLSEVETDEALGAGKTIKDSFEEQIEKLPDWIKKILKVLNEILSILRGGS